jgi:anti-sigma factor RsiW
MPELPPQLPALVGELPAAVPAIVMSLKSQSVAESAAAVKVLGTGNAERSQTRRIDDAPAQVNVPFMIWLAEIVQIVIPVLVGDEIVKLLNVFVPLIL